MKTSQVNSPLSAVFTLLMIRVALVGGFQLKPNRFLKTSSTEGFVTAGNMVTIVAPSKFNVTVITVEPDDKLKFQLSGTLTDPSLRFLTTVWKTVLFVIV